MHTHFNIFTHTFCNSIDYKSFYITCNFLYMKRIGGWKTVQFSFIMLILIINSLFMCTHTMHLSACIIYFLLLFVSDSVAVWQGDTGVMSFWGKWGILRTKNACHKRKLCRNWVLIDMKLIDYIELIVSFRGQRSLLRLSRCILQIINVLFEEKSYFITWKTF